ncbi:hypothetical protein GLAREA_04399 [Glarea lozoyensis ATCC 20868]|uniref:RING-type domain-containing protein n=1 Tax=Glarea lozoyensis (strain ATCC 20868 / MF5171) TaxID=1116229 RepID=S3DM57_GLAL2|nr:uncharacterized protein GLAREA_04399 [Glarea lozoyensis ATCC 20868]EPE27608.1 hypothetical protein GLAREA_04399 [Glarea lozoyensis ATCC 20868]
MPSIWDPRRAFDLYPDEPGFTCCGMALKGLRCGQSFIANRDKVEAASILEDLITNDNIFTSPRALLPDLKRLAEFTLCPRWHRTGHRSQGENVAAKWLSIIQTLDPERQSSHSTRTRRQTLSTPATITVNPSVFTITRRRNQPTRPILLPTSSRSTSNHSRAVSSLPTPPATPPQTSRSSSGPNFVIHFSANSNDAGNMPRVTLSTASRENSTTQGSQDLRNGSSPYDTTTSSSSARHRTPVSVINAFASRQRTRSSLVDPPRSLSVSSRGHSTPRPGSITASTSTSTPEVGNGGAVGSEAEEEINDGTNSASPSSPPRSSRHQSTPRPFPTNSSSSRPPVPPPSISHPTRRQQTEASRKPLPETCLVCLLEIASLSDAVWCKAVCGQNVCKDCWERWTGASENRDSQLKCIFCRAIWEE